MNFNSNIMIEKDIICKDRYSANPFMHIKQKQNGELCLRFLKVTDKQVDLHYTRHNLEFHIVDFDKNLKRRITNTGKRKTIPVYSLKRPERIRAMIISKKTAMRKPIEKIRDIPTLMTIDICKYPKNLIDILIYLNPSVPIDRIIKSLNPIEYIQDNDFKPAILILTFKHSKEFLKLGVDVI